MSQSGSTILSIWYQTTDTLPAEPATLQGQSTRALPCEARLTGALNVHAPRPTWVPATNIIRLGSGVGPPPVLGTSWLQPPVPLGSRSFVSQAKKMFSALSIEISSGAPNGKYTVVGYTTSCGCQVYWPPLKASRALGRRLMPTPMVPSLCVNTAGSIRLPSKAS